MRTATRLLALLILCTSARAESARHLLYVAVPGIRNQTEYGGTGVLVFDIDDGHRLVRRIAVPALGTDTHPEAAKGICASAATGRLYISTPKTLTCLDLTTDKPLWEKSYSSGCDRMSITPDGKTLFEPTFEGKFWHVIDAVTGDETAQITTGSGAHNTICSIDGRHIYLASLHAPLLSVADSATRAITGTTGPFAAPIRPFTVNGRGTLCYVCINNLLGFEIGDLVSGKKLDRVKVDGFSVGAIKRHGCPSHGIGLTPDEKELWLCDAHNKRLHIFDNTVMPPKQETSIPLRDEPGWVTFGIDGRLAYPSTGEVIDVASKKTIATLKDEQGREVQSEKVLEIDFQGARPSVAGEQFGLGRVVDSTR